MASVAVSNITNVTTNISGGLGNPLNIAGQPVEVYRIASGQSSADTVALTPTTFSNVQSVFCTVGATHNLTTNANTNVTLTIQSGTVTVGAFDVYLIGPRS